MITGELLTEIPLFAGLPPNERESLAARAADVRLRQGEWLQMEGQAPAFFALLEGELAVFKSVTGRDTRIHTHTPGSYFGEVPLLLGAPSISSVQATVPSRVVRFDANDFHELVSHCRVLNGQIMKTMAERVEYLQHVAVDEGQVTATLIGDRSDAASHDLRDFLARNRVACSWLSADDPDLEARIRELAPGGNLAQANGLELSKLPVVVLADGRILVAPTNRQIAGCVGLQIEPNYEEYDVVVIGGGPAGLASAVYGASEGLRTLLVEREACGGQAGTSSRIENYLGFPAGLSGDELSGRARQQATRFGAELLVTRWTDSLDLASDSGESVHQVTLDGGNPISAKALVLATGVQWRRLDVPGIDRFAGHGVFYGAALAEAQSLRGGRIHLVGGGNSAGQAALLFSGYAESVTMLVRGTSLAASMSQYLIDQLASKDNVTIETRAEVTRVHGGDRLEAIDVKRVGSEKTDRRPTDALFVFIGAHAATEWLPRSIIRDKWGYVCTGRDVMDLVREQGADKWPLERDPFLLETSASGVFAAGDVRHGSVKRVASAVGEGSMAIAFVHQYLAEPVGVGVRRGSAK
ncbi:MAG TPA: FAD-dependent oxidoreductase [Gemmatimonadaceae bacterium]|jgi:thioredoxin reductase (NADPH)|nr:FAD-dependent oxidoreductase [Gemmatimonadaceae bacterium]